LKKWIGKFIFAIDVFGNSISKSFKTVFISVSFKKKENVSVKLTTNQCHTNRQQTASLLRSRTVQAYSGEAMQG